MITESLPARSGPAAPARPRWWRREPVLVVLLGFALAAAFNLPLIRHPRTTVAADLGDPLLQTWQLAWHRRFLTRGGDFWTANSFFPAQDAFAFSDSLLGYSPLALLFGDGPHAAVLRYNTAYLLACALAFIGAYFLVRQLGGNWQAAALAGAAAAWAPWRLAHGGHLNVLSTGGIALALFALARGHGYALRPGARPRAARPGWVLAGWLIGAWQITLGFAVGIPFFYLMAGVGAVVCLFLLRRRGEPGRRVVLANAVGGAVFLAVTALMAVPYLRVVERYGFTRPWSEVSALSAPPAGLLAVPGSSWLWGGSALDDQAGLSPVAPWENLLFPGLALLVTAFVGLFVSAWPVRVRVVLAVAAVAVTVPALGAGVLGGAYTYRPLWEFLPGWDALRAPGRLVLWTVLLLSLLAAGAVTGLGRRAGGRRRALVAAALVVPAAFTLLEGLPVRPHPRVPDVPPGLAEVFEQVRVPMVVVPMDLAAEFRHLLWSTRGWPTLANGNSGNFPPAHAELVEATKRFPDSHSIDVLDRHGIRALVVVKSAAAGTPWASTTARPTTGYPLTRTETGDVVLFTVK